MKNLFDAAAVMEIRQRVEQLRADSPRQWGTMDAAQMLAHCSAWMEWAVGVKTPPRVLLGRIVGKLAKRSMLGEAPVRRNLPTEKSLVMRGERDFATEQRRLLDWVERFAAGGPEGCTKDPHCFFGRMTPMEWATVGYKHLDHHLKQFGV